EHLRRRGHLEVQQRRHLAAQRFDVVVADMAAIFTQVGRDAVSAGGFAQARREDGIRIAGAASVADGGDVIDVDVEANHGRPHLAGVTAPTSIAASAGAANLTHSPGAENSQSAPNSSLFGVGRGSPFGPSRRTTMVCRVAVSSLSRATTEITFMPGLRWASNSNGRRLGSEPLRFDW